MENFRNSVTLVTNGMGMFVYYSIVYKVLYLFTYDIISSNSYINPVSQWWYFLQWIDEMTKTNEVTFPDHRARVTAVTKLELSLLTPNSHRHQSLFFLMWSKQDSIFLNLLIVQRKKCIKDLWASAILLLLLRLFIKDGSSI
jgi:hypothetical protein